MYGREDIVLRRDVNAVQIPDGTPCVLPQGQVVSLFQSLGGNFTVTTERGYMARIAGADADALGKEPPVMPGISPDADAESVEKNVWEVLRTVYDPEIPVNIVDLGLVYACRVIPDGSGGFKVEIVMTLTAPGCGMGPVLQSDVEYLVKNLPAVTAVEVSVVFDPPWGRDMMSEAAKLQLGML
ncbi:MULTISPECIES: putative Fe-S cluster assembly protein SufT [Methylococcus]|uniref:Fe-S cluster assembly protein SufT n=1 Tax=Methylococcus capsulatus TaxID=414 RepID=A0ABZ2F338_METCP|nr:MULTISPECIES: putative Fe-S cluster assembly protein SufT [Methylococcus]MDF9391933.1 putative Fe-S cluster assembly protein SufT [Methylococcus capsulatus]